MVCVAERVSNGMYWGYIVVQQEPTLYSKYEYCESKYGVSLAGQGNDVVPQGRSYKDRVRIKVVNNQVGSYSQGVLSSGTVSLLFANASARSWPVVLQ